MAITYEFEARNQEGQTISGTLTAEDESRAEKILWQNKLTVISLKPKKELFGFIDSMFGKVTIRDKVIFAKQLATILEAGFPILQGLSIIVLQTTNKKFKETIAKMIHELEEGHSFSTAIGKYPEIFSHMFVNAIKAGEASGNLPKVLRQLSDNLDREYEFNSKVKGAIIYPIFIVVVMIIIGAIMMVKVVPQLEMIFLEAGAQLPWATRAVLWTSHIIQKFWWLIILVVIGIFVAIRAWGETTAGRYQVDLAKIKMPIFSRLSTLIHMARFCRTLSLLTATGIPILQSIKIVSDVMDNVIYENSLDEAYQQVEKGIPLNVPLSKNKYFPAMISHMIGVGEKTGKLDEILKSLASYYELEADSEMKKLSSLLEPILIVIIGVGVAIMVFAIIMPIYNLAQVI